MPALDMLRSTADFKQVQLQSRSRSHPLLLLRYRRNDLERTRYGISTGRKVGPAVVRNAVRRRLRAILRSIDPMMARGWDVLIVARSESAAARQVDLEAALRLLLRGAGLIDTATAAADDRAR